MKRIVYLAICMVCVLVSCNRASEEETEKAITDFPVTESLKGERVDLELPEYLSNMIGVAGDYYVFNAIRAQYCFQVYDKNFNLVDTIGRIGGGPSEIPGSALYLGQWEGQSDSPEILAYTSNSRSLVKLPIKNPTALETVVKLNIMKMPELDPKFLFKADGNMFYGMNLGYTSSCAVFSYDASNEDINMGNPAFEINSALSPLYATQQSMAYDAQNNRICTAYMSFPCFALYDKDLNVTKRFFIGEKFDTETVASDSGDPGLINAQFCNGKILVMYAPDGEEHSLMVFSGKGDPIASYAVGNAIWYVIDKENSLLLTSNYDSEQDVIYLMRYPLPKEI